MGVLLHLRVEGLESGSTAAGPESLSPYARANWQEKHRYALRGQTDPGTAARDDDAEWGGW